MKLSATFSHHSGVEMLQNLDMYEWVTDIFQAPEIAMQRGATREIHKHVKSELIADGWAMDVPIDPISELKVLARKKTVAFQLQTGNISRYAYDLLKLQHWYIKHQIECGILAVPTRECARKLGSNVANSDRIWAEMQLFNRTIFVPIMVISFE